MSSEYFKHDTTASSDHKILQLEVQFGCSGYAWYFKTLEWLYQNVDATVDADAYADALRPLAFYLRLTEDKTKEFLDKCIELGLLEIEDGLLFSRRLMENKKEQLEKSEKGKLAAEIRWGKRNRKRKTKNANAYADAMPVEESRVEKSRVEESMNKQPKKIAEDFFNDKNQQQQVIDYLVENGASVERAAAEIDKFVDYWTEPNPSGTKVRWQLEKTFDVKRRLKTWFNNFEKFNKNDVGNIVFIS